MLGTGALDQRACLFKLDKASVQVCSAFSQPAAQASLPHGQQTYLNQQACLLQLHPTA